MGRRNRGAVVGTKVSANARFRLELVQDLAGSLFRAVSVQDASRALVLDGCRVVGADGGLVAAVRGDWLEVTESAGAPLPVEVDERVPLDSESVLAACARDRRTVWVDGAGCSIAAAPVIADGRVAAVVAFGFRSGIADAADVQSLCGLVADLGGHALERAERFDAETASRETLLHILGIAPQFGGAESREAVAAAVCREARDAFRADVTLVLRLADANHFVVEAREPTTTLIPPGRMFAAADLPDLGEIVRDLRSTLSAGTRRISGRGGAALDQRAGSSIIGVPISIHGETGRLLVVQWLHEMEAPDPRALLVLQRFADQAGLALERADRRRAEQDARRNTRQTQRLLALSAALAAARTVDDVAAALTAEARAQMGAEGATVFAVVDGRSLEVLAAARSRDRDEPAVLALDDDVMIAEAVRRGEVVLVESAQARAQRYPAVEAGTEDGAHGASASVPLSAADSIIGGVELFFAEDREFSSRDREFLAAFGRQGGVALDRARLHTVEHSVATRLQRQLLPLRLPTLPGLRCAAEYQAGTELMEVGGDWYDVVQLEQAIVALTVGDVVGKGVGAAGVMGRLRSALRALALACSDPGEIIVQLERFARTIDGADFATLCYADLDLETGLLRYISAGHPPMLVADGSGDVRFAAGGRTTPLCVELDAPKEHDAIVLDPGSTLVLYSDGLIERRGGLLEPQYERLREQTRSLAHLPPAQLASTLVQAMTEGSPAGDDVVVLAVRFDPR
jgi:GAF domain-containing protein